MLALQSVTKQPRERLIRALNFAAKNDLPGVHEAATALAQSPSPLRADAYRALAKLPAGVPAEQIEQLLGDGDADLRVAAVEIAGAELRARSAQVTVRFVSKLVSATGNRRGARIEGNRRGRDPEVPLIYAAGEDLKTDDPYFQEAQSFVGSVLGTGGPCSV